MSIDLSKSRRDYHVFCRYWKRNESDEYTPDELIYKRIPSGSFWAKEMSPEQDRDNIIGGVFNFDSTHITIKSPDNCDGLDSKDLVEYEGEYWMVVSVQKTKARIGNKMYAKDKYCSHYWYIELRK